MRISDWSSDVCSSDLLLPVGHIFERQHGDAGCVERHKETADAAVPLRLLIAAREHQHPLAYVRRSAERLLPVEYPPVAVAARVGLERGEVGTRAGLGIAFAPKHGAFGDRSEEHTSELQSLMRTSYAVFC